MQLSLRRLLPLLLLLAAASLLLALCTGSHAAPPEALLRALLGDGDPLTRDIVLRLRLPRALAAFGTGACLALAGAMLQALLRNPLADPYILGTSGGAAVAALAAMLAGLAGSGIELAAFGGALLSTALVFGLSSAGSPLSPPRLLLTGVVLAAGWSALISLMLAISPDTNLRGILFWLMGDFAFASSPWPSLLVAAAGTAGGVLLGRSLNLLTTGEMQASLLGLRVGPTRSAVYLLASLLTAVAVTTAGTVGFIGLVVPHLMRLLSGADHRRLLPAAALAGGSLLTLADTLARSVLAPRQLPVGAITALLGVPLFLYLLRRADPAARQARRAK
ncbi:MAG: iron ABC transporter permease [Gammaproteobacteria bacterium]|nr:MAG: iron ABC transporter permease [Gammaproteobacteria bacterium]